MSWCRYTQEAASFSEIMVPTHQSPFFKKKKQFSFQTLVVNALQNWSIVTDNLLHFWVPAQTYTEQCLKFILCFSEFNYYISCDKVWHTLSVKCLAMPVTLFTSTSVFSTESFQKSLLLILLKIVWATYKRMCSLKL